MNLSHRLSFSLLITLMLSINSPAQTVSLADMQPSRVLNHNLKQSASVQAAKVEISNGQRADAVVLPPLTEVTYDVPAGKNTFSGILVYHPQPMQRSADSPPSYNLLLVRILSDNKVLWEQGLDGTSPPVFFSVPVTGSSKVTIVSETAFTGPGFYIANSVFLPQKHDSQSGYLPESGQGYADASPSPRQTIAHIYHSGETVGVGVYYSGSAAQADLHITATPEWNHNGNPESDIHVPVSLRPFQPGVVRGDVNWKVPSTQGPFRIAIEVTANGKSVFQRQMEIGIGPVVDLADISDNSFGVQLSVAGLPLVFDEFAGTWGAKWVRLFTRWSVIESNRGTYDFSHLDAQIRIFRSQNLRVLPALGEDAPAWAGVPGTADYDAAWKRFVSATVEHYRGQIDTWDVFNEVDVKYAALNGKAADPDWDLAVLRSAIATIRAADPRAHIVCCSTGSLTYDQRLIDSGIYQAVDIASLHPYQSPAPELKDGPSNVVEKISVLRDLLHSRGINKPIWATEANWLMGPSGVRDVNAPGITEQAQAEYIVRANLLSGSQGAKYFVHEPFYTYYHPQPLVRAWAAYTQMASLFGRASQPTLMMNGPQAFGVVANSTSGNVGALWTASGFAQVALTGGNYRFFDMYGNPIAADPTSIGLTTAPLYFQGSGIPQVRIISQATNQWKPIGPLSSWTCAKALCTPAGPGRHVEIDASQPGNHLYSPPFVVRSNSCLVVQMRISMEKGTIILAPVDGATGQLLDNRKVSVEAVPAGQSQTVEFRFRTGSSTSAKIVIAIPNRSDSQSVFTVSDTPQTAECQ
jgi:hypothetical protein